MKLKTKLILGRVTALLIGLISLVMGQIKSAQQLECFGIALIISSLILLIKKWKVISSPEKMKELENMYKDERTLFIANKSHSFAFWISVYTETIALLVLMCFNKEKLSTLLSMVVCFQVIIYALANIFYHKKY